MLKEIATPKTDYALETFTLRTKEGISLNDVITENQKHIAEAIIGRTAPDGSGRKRVHIMAHTRYGKSLVVGAAVAIRASMKGEPWAIVAPTKEQAQIIMDYVIWISVNDPIISQLLSPDIAKNIKTENLTHRRSRDHITYHGGGEVRTFSPGTDGKGVMGFGSPNVVLDEAGLIGNELESKIFRMLGDHTDNFYVKIGNPFEAMDESGEPHHFAVSYEDPTYWSLNIDWRIGVKEGRLTEAFVKEVEKKPNFDVLYENLFPDVDKQDKDGYNPLFTQRMLKKAVVEAGSVESVGSDKLGADPADSGDNEGVICLRSFNLARVPYNKSNSDVLTFADEVMKHGARSMEWYMDRQGVGIGAVRRIERSPNRHRLTPINAGLPAPEDIKEDGRSMDEIYENLRAYMFFKAAEWLNQGGKLEARQGVEWRQLLAVKWKNNKRGRIQIIDKDRLQRRKVKDLGIADAFSFTFGPRKKQMPANARPTGGVEPMIPSLEKHRPIEGPSVQAKPYFPKIAGRF